MCRTASPSIGHPGLVNLDEARHLLYSGAPEQFVATRTQLVKQARSDGQRDVGAAIAALRRPSAAAGLLNLLARHDPDAVSALRSIGDQLRTAQRAGDGDAIRALSATRRQAMATAMSAVTALARDHDRVLSAAVRADVESSLAAAILDVDSADALAAGVLSDMLHQVGFGDWTPTADPSVHPRTGPQVARPFPQPSRPALRAVPDLAREPSRRTAHLERAEKAAAELEQAQDRAAGAQQRVEGLLEQIVQLRSDLAAATTEARHAREAQRKASRAAEAALRRLKPGVD